MRAFTLLEVLITLSLLTIVGSSLSLYGLDMYTRAFARNDGDLLLTALLYAREQSLDDQCTHTSCTEVISHGVFLSPKDVTVFEGTSYAARYASIDLVIPFSSKHTIGSTNEVVFAASTAEVSSRALLSLLDGPARTYAVGTDGSITAP